jgi:putative ABC transport system ATP-binding protein
VRDAPADSRVVVLEAVALTKTYVMGELEVQALRGVDLVLYEGEFMVLLGPSGSGKSTLLNILGGLDVPTAGRVTYRSGELTGATETARGELPISRWPSKRRIGCQLRP